MTEYPMQPSPEQFAGWLAEAVSRFPAGPSGEIAAHVARHAYAAGADAELKACCDVIYLREEQPLCGGTAEWLRAARRPKSPSLKQQALELMQTHGAAALKLDPGQCETIRRALEALPND